MSGSSPIGSVPAVSVRSCAWWQVGFVCYEQRSLETHGYSGFGGLHGLHLQRFGVNIKSGVD